MFACLFAYSLHFKLNLPPRKLAGAKELISALVPICLWLSKRGKIGQRDLTRARFDCFSFGWVDIFKSFIICSLYPCMSMNKNAFWVFQPILTSILVQFIAKKFLEFTLMKH
jgi:hypothetical protein